MHSRTMECRSRYTVQQAIHTFLCQQIWMGECQVGPSSALSRKTSLQPLTAPSNVFPSRIKIRQRNRRRPTPLLKWPSTGESHLARLRSRTSPSRSLQLPPPRQGTMTPHMNREDWRGRESHIRRLCPTRSQDRYQVLDASRGCLRQDPLRRAHGKGGRVLKMRRCQLYSHQDIAQAHQDQCR